jgi:hypothetical protein
MWLQEGSVTQRKRALRHLRQSPERLLQHLELLEKLLQEERSTSQKAGILRCLESLKSRVWSALSIETLSALLNHPQLQRELLRWLPCLTSADTKPLQLLLALKPSSDPRFRQQWLSALPELPLPLSQRWQTLWKHLSEEQDPSVQESGLFSALQLLRERAEQQNSLSRQELEAWKSPTLSALQAPLRATRSTGRLAHRCLEQWVTLEPEQALTALQQADEDGDTLWLCDLAEASARQLIHLEMEHCRSLLFHEDSDVTIAFLRGLQRRFVSKAGSETTDSQTKQRRWSEENLFWYQDWAALLSLRLQLSMKTEAAEQLFSTLSSLPEELHSLVQTELVSLPLLEEDKNDVLQGCLACLKPGQQQHWQAQARQNPQPTKRWWQRLTRWALQDSKSLQAWCTQWSLLSSTREQQSLAALMAKEVRRLAITKASLATGPAESAAYRTELKEFWKLWKQSSCWSGPDARSTLQQTAVWMALLWWEWFDLQWKETSWRFWRRQLFEGCQPQWKEQTHASNIPGSLLHLLASDWTDKTLEQFTDWYRTESADAGTWSDGEEMMSFAALQSRYREHTQEEALLWMKQAVQLKRQWLASTTSNRALSVWREEMGVTVERASHFREPWELVQVIHENLQMSPHKAAWDTSIAAADMHLLDPEAVPGAAIIPDKYVELRAWMRHWHQLLKGLHQLQKQPLPLRPSESWQESFLSHLS